MIILDLGNGSVLKNDWGNIKATIDAIATIDVQRECIIKFQLFSAVPPKTPLRRDLFYQAWQYGTSLGFEVTSSIFDFDSLDFLSRMPVSMVKLANRMDSKIYFFDARKRFEEVIVSTSDAMEFEKHLHGKRMACVSQYPATIDVYENRFEVHQLGEGISDHTSDLKLFRKYQPRLYERHFVLDSVSTDAPRQYAMRPADLEELLWYAR